MIDYNKLSEAELDMRLLVAYLPKRVDRIMFADRYNFFTFLYPAIVAHKLQDPFAEYVAEFLGVNKLHNAPIEEIILPVITVNDRILRMSALKAYDEYKQYLERKVA